MPPDSYRRQISRNTLGRTQKRRGPSISAPLLFLLSVVYLVLDTESSNINSKPPGVPETALLVASETIGQSYIFTRPPDQTGGLSVGHHHLITSGKME